MSQSSTADTEPASITNESREHDIRTRFTTVLAGAGLDVLVQESTNDGISRKLANGHLDELLGAPSRRNLFFGKLTSIPVIWLISLTD
jgi:hypothetical protein